MKRSVMEALPQLFWGFPHDVDLPDVSGGPVLDHARAARFRSIWLHSGSGVWRVPSEHSVEELGGGSFKLWLTSGADRHSVDLTELELQNDRLCGAAVEGVRVDELVRRFESPDGDWVGLASMERPSIPVTFQLLRSSMISALDSGGLDLRDSPGLSRQWIAASTGFGKSLIEASMSRTAEGEAALSHVFQYGESMVPRAYTHLQLVGEDGRPASPPLAATEPADDDPDSWWPYVPVRTSERLSIDVLDDHRVHRDGSWKITIEMLADESAALDDLDRLLLRRVEKIRRRKTLLGLDLAALEVSRVGQSTWATRATGALAPFVVAQLAPAINKLLGRRATARIEVTAQPDGEVQI